MGKIRNFFENEYGKHLLTVISGTGVAQLVPILFYPIISRLFSPENFGTLATVTQIASISAVLASWKYEMNILLCKTDKEAVNLITLIIILSLGILVILFNIFYFNIDYFVKIFHDKELRSVAPFPFLTAFFIIIYQSYNEWCVRKKYFRNLSMNKVLNSSSISLGEFIAGVVRGLQSASLVIGDICGRMISACSCLGSFLKKDGSLLKTITIQDIKKSAINAKDCPKYLLPAQLLSTVGQALPVFMLGFFFNQKDVGFFSMAFMVVVIPTSVISIAFRDVFRQKAISQVNAGGNCRNLFVLNFKILSTLSIIIFGALYIIAPWLFSFVLGEEWITSGYLTRLLVPMVATSFVSESLSAMMIISKKMNYQFLWQICYVVLTFLALFVGSYTHSIYRMILFFSVGRIIAYILSLTISYKLTLR